MTTLYYYLEKDGKDLYASACLGEEEQERTYEGRKRELLAHFATIYDTVENLSRGRHAELRRAVDALSEALVAPFASYFARCTEVRVVLPLGMLRCWVDLLELEGQPLCLRFPVSYVLDDDVDEYGAGVRLQTGLLVSDRTADPERACEAVQRLFPRSVYKDVSEVDSDFVVEHGEQDFLVLSAHGSLEGDGEDDEEEGEIELQEDDSIEPEQLGELGLTLAYFDSCQMGVSPSFVEAFYEEGSTRYYLAPVCSNDAGDSSTLTMTWFFESLRGNGFPARALFETKTRLFQHYSRRGLDPVTVLNKSFPFRLYEFDNT